MPLAKSLPSDLPSRSLNGYLVRRTLTARLLPISQDTPGISMAARLASALVTLEHFDRRLDSIAAFTDLSREQLRDVTEAFHMGTLIAVSAPSA